MLIGVYGGYNNVCTTTTTTTCSFLSSVAFVNLQGDSGGHHGLPWRPRWATRADDRRDSSGGSSPPLSAEGGSCTEQRSMEPEDRQSKWESTLVS